jgi:selenocysteine lyase/cysteine desulfurase
MPPLLDALGSIPGLSLRGITDTRRLDERVPTVAFTIDGHSPAEIATFLGDRGIATWDGDYYAYELIRSLGLAETGGMVRVGLVHYNTLEEIGRLEGALRELTAR